MFYRFLVQRFTLMTFVGLVFLPGCRGWESSQPPVHLNWNMDTQEKLKPYRHSDFFSDGRAMQTPPEGSVPRTLKGNAQQDSVFLGNDSIFIKGQSSAGAFVNSYPKQVQVNEATMLRGQERYNIYCAPCHSKAGDGKGTVARRLKVKPPSFVDPARKLWKKPVGHFYDAITNGVNAPNMPSYADQIPVEDRWAIVLYLRALMKSQKSDVSFTAPSALQGG